jgi:hypothetical protein
MSEIETFSLEKHLSDWSNRRESVTIEGTLQVDGNYYVIASDPARPGPLFRVRKTDLLLDPVQTRTLRLDSGMRQFFRICIKRGVPVWEVNIIDSGLLEATSEPKQKFIAGSGKAARANGPPAITQYIDPRAAEAQNMNVLVVIQVGSGGDDVFLGADTTQGTVEFVPWQQTQFAYTHWAVLEGQKRGPDVQTPVVFQSTVGGPKRWLDAVSDVYLSPGYGPPYFNTLWQSRQTLSGGVWYHIYYWNPEGSNWVRYYLAQRWSDGKLVAVNLPNPENPSGYYTNFAFGVVS